MTSTPSISRLLMRAWAPVSFIACSLLPVTVPDVTGRATPKTDRKNPSPGARGGERTDAPKRRALGDYENGGREGMHGTDILTHRDPRCKQRKTPQAGLR